MGSRFSALWLDERGRRRERSFLLRSRGRHYSVPPFAKRRYATITNLILYRPGGPRQEQAERRADPLAGRRAAHQAAAGAPPQVRRDGELHRRPVRVLQEAPLGDADCVEVGRDWDADRMDHARAKERKAQREALAHWAYFLSERNVRAERLARGEQEEARGAEGMYRCGVPSCRSTRCLITQLQTRSADEGMTTYITCQDCGKRRKVG
ncbi:hypothetical protein QOT17_019801 [Balamuthia mandrillaris]